MTGTPRASCSGSRSAGATAGAEGSAISTSGGPAHYEIRLEGIAGIMRRRLPQTEHAGAWLIDFAPGTEWPEVDVHATEERYYVVSGEVIEWEERYGAGT